MEAQPASRIGARDGVRRRGASWRALVDRAGSACEVGAGAALVFIMLLTCADIVGRMFGRPIPGTYEVVSFSGGLIAGLALPATARAHGHVLVDLVTMRLTARAARRLNFVTRLAGIAVLLVVAWGIVGVGNDLRASGEVSAVLALPFYPIAYGMAGAVVLSCLSMLAAFGAPQGGLHE
jgi:TRAP-type C4-dicarboxylate transport system permease small subunit